MTNTLAPAVARLEVSILVPFRVVDDDGEPPRSMGELAAQLKAAQPRLWQEPEEPVALADKGRAYQAYAYFHPFVRRFLYDPKRVLRLERNDLVRLEVQPDGYPLPAMRSLQVLACRLWLFERTEVGMLQLVLSGPSPDECWPLKDVQRLLDQVRRLYAPYFGNIDPASGGTPYAGHCPVSVELFMRDEGEQQERSVGKTDFTDALAQIEDGERWMDFGRGHETRASFCWAPHWQTILHPLSTRPQSASGAAAASCGGIPWHAVQLGDDRAALMSFIGFQDAYQFRAVSAGNWVRLCFADAPGDDPLPYQDGFLAGSPLRPGFQDRYCYDRYFYSPGESSDAPSRIMNCGYAFTWAGCADDKWYFADEVNGAFATFRHIYVPMGVIAHFQRAALLDTSFRISCLVGADPEMPVRPRETRQAYEAFIAFTQWYWFDEISPQEQGQQLFDMWRRELRLVELFGEVRQELRDLVESQNATEQIKQADATVQLTHLATAFATLSVLLAFLSFAAGWFGMNVFHPADAFRLDERVAVVAVWVMVALGAAAVLFGGLVVIRWRKLVGIALWGPNRPGRPAVNDGD